MINVKRRSAGGKAAWSGGEETAPGEHIIWKAG